MGVKQVIVYRRDLTMRKGKMAAQATHAVKKILFDRGWVTRTGLVEYTAPGECMDGDELIVRRGVPALVVPLTEDMATWIEALFTAIVLSVENEADLLRAYQLAREAGLPCSLVTDAGVTEFRKPCPDCDTECDRHHYLMADGTCSCGRPDRECESCGGRGVPNPTNTCIAIGPGDETEIDKITGPDGVVPTKLA